MRILELNEKQLYGSKYKATRYQLIDKWLVNFNIADLRKKSGIPGKIVYNMIEYRLVLLKTPKKGQLYDTFIINFLIKGARNEETCKFIVEFSSEFLNNSSKEKARAAQKF